MSGPRILFFGMECLFSRAPLAALLQAGYTVGAVVVPSPTPDAVPGPPVRLLPPAGSRSRRHSLPLLAAPAERTVAGLAHERGIPVLAVGRLSQPEVVATLRDLAPTVICVACFPWLLPRAVLHLAPHGALNVHPSLLPAYRGPSPLFWVFHDGLEHAGVTVHLMNQRADAGDILGQAPLVLPDGVPYSHAEHLCSREGGRLLVEAVRALHEGTARPAPQPLLGAPAAPAPGDEDFTITPAWPARRAFNFIRGLAGWGRPITLQLPTTLLVVESAGSFDAKETMTVPVERSGAQLKVRCSPGTLTLTLRER